MPARFRTPPGASPFSPETARAIDDALSARPRHWRPRTRHIDDEGPLFTNRLALETSPYLQQHAHNPVNWQPWGEAAFDEARALDRPVFLSIGYATCHWCHVMEEESFEDVDIATYVNEHFVAIKVDREERPDVDAIYMAAVQAMTGHGGWPMTIFMDHARVPFFGGTYFPPVDGARGARRGFASILRLLDEAWREKRDDIVAGREEVRRTIVSMLAAGRPSDVDDAAVLDAAVRFYKRRYDPVHGGLDVTQKFPSSLPVRLLMQHGALADDDDARGMAKTTLDAMARGGIHDHVAGGFHRYSVDPEWCVPHFEKMLYDNALLLDAFVDGHVAFDAPLFRAAANGIVAWVAREMTADDGTFFSAMDADSLSPSGEREEGAFCTWTPDELIAELGHELGARFADVYGVTARGNFEGRTVLTLTRANVSAALDDEMARARAALLVARSERPPPLTDDKRLIAWNGLMIAALARGGRLLEEPAWIAMAARAADALFTHAERRGRLFRVLSRSGGEDRTKLDALLDDHAHLCRASLELFFATMDPTHLARARALDEEIARRFEDREHGGFFATPDDGETLLVREKPAHDGAEPSGASVHARTLLSLAALTGEHAYAERAHRAIRAMGETLARAPHAMGELLLALSARRAGVKEVVLVGDDEDDLRAFTRVLSRVPHPHVTVRATRASANALAREPALRALLAGRLPDPSGSRASGPAIAYVCEDGVCALPSTTGEALASALGAKREARSAER